MKENWMLLLVVRMTSFLEVNWSFIQWLGTKCIEIGVGWGGIVSCLSPSPQHHSLHAEMKGNTFFSSLEYEIIFQKPSWPRLPSAEL